ncbi:homeobox transcription factor (RfeB) [Planoprotostelium fungivorum]|uniref:Homeobox transcription factor (RfeB) n=1 Tax=Planoprotostelium fungivorum TaxID=1890364 RepID=A0A2P6NRL1_9EUKA|nr:homeobox transcription factor (RfeB) [Planoprotostelium fungivorum]
MDSRAVSHHSISIAHDCFPYEFGMGSWVFNQAHLKGSFLIVASSTKLATIFGMQLLIMCSSGRAPTSRATVADQSGHHTNSPLTSKEMPQISTQNYRASVTQHETVWWIEKHLRNSRILSFGMSKRDEMLRTACPRYLKMTPDESKRTPEESNTITDQPTDQTMKISELIHHNDCQIQTTSCGAIEKVTATSLDESKISNCTKRKKFSRQNFPPDMRKYMEVYFRERPYPTPDQRNAIANRFNTTPRKIQVWFQNRRARLVVEGAEAGKCTDPQKESSISPRCALNFSCVKPHNSENFPRTTDLCNESSHAHNIRNTIMSREPHEPQTETDLRRSHAQAALRRHLQRLRDAPLGWNKEMDTEREDMDTQGDKMRLFTVPEEEHALQM